MFFIFFALIIIFVIGYSISSFFLADKARKIEILPIAFVVGLMLMSYFVLFAAILSGSFANGVWAFMALGAIYSVYFGFRSYRILKNVIGFKKINKNFLIGKLKEVPWMEVIFFLLFVVFFFNIFSKTIFYENGIYKVAAAGYGDIPFHMSQVSYFIHNFPFALKEPIYSGIPLVYAFLINLLSGVFYVLSGNYILSFNLPSYILLFAGFFFIYKFISAFIKTAFARILTFLIFLLGAGTEFIKVFSDSTLWSKSSIGEMVNYILHLPYSIVNLYNAAYPAQNNIWSSFMTMFLMHQRSFFFGFAVSAMILYILSEVLKNKEKKYLYFVGLLIGFLPLAHMHSFIAVLIIVFGFFIWKIFIGDKTLIKYLFGTLGIGAMIGSLISYLFIFEPMGGSSFLTIRLGWMSEAGGIGSILYGAPGNSQTWAWFLYLWENFGLFFPLLVLAIVYYSIRKNEFWRKKDPIYGLIFGVVFIFIVVNIIKFQPWDYDNGKIFGYFYLLGSIIIVYFFQQWKFRFAKIIAVFLTFFLISVGLIDTFSRSSYAEPTFYGIFGEKEQKTAEWIVNNTAPAEIILTGTSHLNPVNSLAGRSVLVGYPGWLWSHGIKYGEREADIYEIYRNSGNVKELLEKYNIRYVYIGSAEKSIFGLNQQFFNENYPVVFEEGDIKVYKVK